MKHFSKKLWFFV